MNTENETWGFYGTMGALADVAWPLAMKAVQDATNESPDAVRSFLDSRHGRQFAGDVQDAIQGAPLKSAITATAQKWNAWTIGRRVGEHFGIPVGTPYLTGFVVACDIADSI